MRFFICAHEEGFIDGTKLIVMRENRSFVCVRDNDSMECLPLEEGLEQVWKEIFLGA